MKTNKLKAGTYKEVKHQSRNFVRLTKSFIDGDQEVTTKNAIATFSNDGILRVVWKKNSEIHLQESKELVYKINYHNKRWSVLVDLREIKYQSKSSRDYLASEEVVKHSNAIALLTNSIMSTFIGNLYMNLSNPVSPTRLFTSEKKAIEWLKKFVD